MTRIGKTKISKKNATSVPPAIRQALGINAGNWIEWHIKTFDVLYEKEKTITVVTIEKEVKE